MNRITKENYEAFLLDRAEGTLGSNQLAALETFMKAHPELEDIAADLNLPVLKAASTKDQSWSALKRGDLGGLKDNAELRDQLYFADENGELNVVDKSQLKELLKEETYRREYDLWKSLAVKASSHCTGKDQLYHLELEEHPTPFNYEYWLAAKTEGLLSDTQSEVLKRYAGRLKNGTRDLALADRLRLEPAKAIFYGNRDGLKKKDSRMGIIWFYRLAAAAAVLLLIFFAWQKTNTTEIPVAEKKSAPRLDETKEVMESENKDSIKTNLPLDSAGTDVKPEEKPQEIDLFEWERREPDPSQYAEAAKPSEISRNSKPALKQENRVAKLEPIDEIESIETEQPVFEVITLDQPLPQNEIAAAAQEERTLPSKHAKSKKNSEFQTIPEYAESILADRLNVPDSARDQMALTLAKRAADKAGEFFDAEITKEKSSAEGIENLTYTLRVGSFSVSRSRTR